MKELPPVRREQQSCHHLRERKRETILSKYFLFG